MIELTDEEREELEQLLLDVVYEHPIRDYDLAILFNVLTKVENND